MPTTELRPTRVRTSPAVRRGERCVLERLGDRWPAGGQLPAIRELARIMDVAPGTAHQVVRNLAREGLLEPRSRAGVYVTSRFSDAELRDLCHWRCVPRPRSLQGRQIDAVFANLPGDRFIERMVEAFDGEVRARGGQMCRRPIQPPGRMTELTLTTDADGVAVFNIDHFLQDMVGARPLVWVTTGFNAGLRRSGYYDVVSIDQRHGGMLAADALRDSGCQRACVIGVGPRGDEFAALSMDRLRGFAEAWIDPRQLVTLRADWYGRVAGQRCVDAYLQLRPRPDGVFAVTDELAVGFVEEATRRGLSAGRDFCIVGFDGQDIGRDLPGGPLTTVAVPALELGRRAAEMLDARFSPLPPPPQRVLLRAALQTGATTEPRHSSISPSQGVPS